MDFHSIIRMSDPTRIMFVCLGNHCRSPLAHGYFEHILKKYGIEHKILVDSSGTSSWHVGDLPDSRVRKVAEKNGFTLRHIRGKNITEQDLKIYDLILVMDQSNLRDVLALDREGRYVEKVKLLRTFDPESALDEIPDPYYSGIFEEVYVIVSQACDALLKHLLQARNTG